MVRSGDVEAESAPLLGDDGFPSAPLKQRPSRLAYISFFFVVLPVFAAYACGFSLQSRLLNYRVNPAHSTVVDDEFGLAVSLLYWGNLLFRLGHAVAFPFLSPFFRVALAIGTMLAAELIFSWIMFCTESVSVVPVAIAYALSGVGIGTFEACIMSLASVASNARRYALVAIPCGISAITILGFLFLDLADDGRIGLSPSAATGCLYFAVAVMLAAALAILLLRLPRTATEDDNQSLQYIKAALRREAVDAWFPHVWLAALCMMLNMFSVSLTSSGFMQFMYDDPIVQFRFLPMRVENATFVSILGVATFVGDFGGRAIGPVIKVISPPLWLIGNVIGVALAFSMAPELAVLGSGLVMAGNGLIYSQSMIRIDRHVAPLWNLVATSTFLFTGDVGSVVSSSIQQPLKHLLKPNHA
jgi:hypothetical protein